MREGYRRLNERLDAETRAKQSGRVQTETALLRRVERELDLDES